MGSIPAAAAARTRVLKFKWPLAISYEMPCSRLMYHSRLIASRLIDLFELAFLAIEASHYETFLVFAAR
jgi:hypothetical protein